MDFAPFTPSQKHLLDELEGLKKVLKDYHGLSPELVPEEVEPALRDLHELSAKALRSGLVRKGAEGVWHLHPDLPDWAKKHFKEWVLTQRVLDGRKQLRKAKLGLEAGLKPPVNLELKYEVLRLRNVQEEDVICEFDFKGHLQEKKRVRKERMPWNKVIKKLVEWKLLPKPMSPQGLKKKLKTDFPEIDWDRV